MLKFDIELSFPNCEHKEKLTLTSKDKRGVETTCQLIIEKRKGLCGNCYGKI